MSSSKLRCVASSLAVLLMAGSAGAQVQVILEDFQDDPGGGWLDNFGNVPQNAGRPGVWHNSGHVAGGNADNDWRPLVQNQVAAGGGPGSLPGGDYIASLNRTGNQTGVPGVFNMDGIIQFTLADGTPRPAVTGDRIVGSFTYYAQEGNFGFGFTRSIAGLQAYQATIPVWNGSIAPLQMPTAFTDQQNGIQVGISPDITGHIALNAGFNNLCAHAVVDADNDGFVDAGAATPKTDPNSTANRPLLTGATQQILFEYTVGSSIFDVLKVDQDYTGPLPAVDILQSLSTATPNPGGPMPVGAIFTSIEGLFITGSNGRLTEVWYDNINVRIFPVPEPTSLAAMGLAAGMLIRRKR